MPLWGNSSSNKKQPAWFGKPISSTLNVTIQQTDIFATAQGWIQRHWKGAPGFQATRFWDEPLVRMDDTNTANAITNATVQYVYFSNPVGGAFVQGVNAHVTVVFNKAVTVTGTPTLLVQGSSTNATATYVSNNIAGNKLNFKFTIPAATQTIFVRGQALGGGATIVDSSPSNNAAVQTFANTVLVGIATDGQTLTTSANVAIA